MQLVITSERQRQAALRRLEGLDLPLVISVEHGRRRTIEQNRLQRLWCNEIAEQLGDRTAEEVRAFCKLTIGVPILRAENERFAERYDKIVKPLPYEVKLAIMAEPLDLPVTRLMTVRQKARYLDEMARYWTDKGIVLTDPDDLPKKPGP